MKHRLLASAIFAVLLTSCASGGGSSDNNGGGGVTVVPDFQPPAGHPEWSYQRNSINLDPAQANYTGRGVVVGIFDILPDMNYVPLQGQGNGSNPQVSDGQPSNITDQGDRHGTAVATVLLGKPWGAWRGGVAPGASLIFTNRGSAANIRQMTDRGMDVFNQSVQSSTVIGEGSDSAQRDYFQASGLLDAYRYFKDNGGIVVHAAGNAGRDQPNTNGAVPYYYPEMTNWITVVALDMQGTSIASYSNRCGLMAQQCLAAPGTWRLIWPTPGQPADFSYRWTGTSFAAPAVSGVAALVKEAFPWMNGTQIAQTLFTTATDMGAVGVDTTYGWGEVNAGRAVLGPAALTAKWDAFIPTGITSTFGNDISGVGGLSKDGNGTLVLDGHNTYQGGTFLNGGGLFINGSVAGNVLQTAGAVGGGGTIFGDLNQQGGALALTVGQTLNVAGTATLSGDVSLRPGANFTGNQTSSVFTANQINGQVQVRDDALFFDSSLTQVGNVLTGSVARRSGAQTVAQNGLGDATTARAAGNLDSVFAVSDAQGGGFTASQQQLLDNANNLRRSEVAAISLDSMAGQAHATARGMAVQTAEVQQHWITDRVRDAADTPNGGAWIMAGYQDGTIRPGNAFNADVRSDSIVGGIDKRFGDNFVAGVAVQKAETRSNFNRYGGSVDTDQAGLSAYGAWQPNDQWTVSGHASYSKLDNTVDRVILMGAGGLVQTKTDADLLSVGLRAERKLSKHLAAIGQFSHDRVKSDGFTEAGTTGFELVAAPSTAKNTTAGVGVLLHDGKEVAQVGWRFEGEVMYVRTLGKTDTGFNAAYADFQDAWFKVDGMDIARDSAWLSGSVSYKFNNQGSLFLSSYLQHNSNGSNTSFTVGYRKEF